MASVLSMSTSPIETPQLVPDIRHTSSLSPISTPHRSRNARLGSLSPGSIPSSPTSVHSTSSAIFERDIEPLPASLSSTALLGVGTMSTSPSNPHRTPRGRTAEDSAVPSVLTSAASALVSLPASPGPSAPASPLAKGTTMDDPFVVIAATTAFPTRSGRASRETSPGRASLFERKPRRQSTAGSAHSGASPTQPMSSFSNALSLSAGPAPSTSSAPPPTLNLGEAALVPQGSNNRLSFVSYNDILLSAPVSAVPLTQLTQPTSTDPPPHLPSTFASPGIAPGPRSGGHSPAHSRPRSVVMNNRTSVIADGNSLVMSLVDEGGEWEREGLGRGLEERLEELLRREAGQSPAHLTVAPPPAS